MSKEDFRKLLSQWANEDVYIGQLTWEEGDALAERLANWHASQHLRAPDEGYCRCNPSTCGTIIGTYPARCSSCNRPRR